VDIFRWPWLRGQEPSGSDPEQVVERLEAAIRPQHHLVDLGTGSELLLIALGRRPARSLSVAGFFASAATLKTAGEHGLAAAVLAVTALSVTPAQIVRIAMQGAAEDETRAAVTSVEASVDKELFANVIRRYHATDFTGRVQIDLPALYLQMLVPVPGSDRLDQVFKRMAPAAEMGELELWPSQVYEEAGGHELADKVIPFIQKVIAERGASAQA
jgi:phosphotransferase system HPr-like phosphotransfer protein